jgi:hypothetical protein
MPRPRRYAVLDEIPETLSVVMDHLDLAKGYTLGNPERTRLIIGAGQKAYGTIVDSPEPHRCGWRCNARCW